jgi:hypothetical protein
MPQKKHKPEEIVVKLRQFVVLVSQGRPVAEARHRRRTQSSCPFSIWQRATVAAISPDQDSEAA